MTEKQPLPQPSRPVNVMPGKIPPAFREHVLAAPFRSCACGSQLYDKCYRAKDTPMLVLFEVMTCHACGNELTIIDPNAPPEIPDTPEEPAA